MYTRDTDNVNAVGLYDVSCDSTPFTRTTWYKISGSRKGVNELLAWVEERRCAARYSCLVRRARDDFRFHSASSMCVLDMCIYAHH